MLSTARRRSSSSQTSTSRRSPLSTAARWAPPPAAPPRPAFPVVARGAGGRDPLVGLGVGQADDLAVGVVGEQHAGLFEALPYGRDPEGQTATGDAEPGRRVGVGPAVA